MFEVFVLCLLTWERRGISRAGRGLLNPPNGERAFSVLPHVACCKSSFVFKCLRAGTCRNRNLVQHLYYLCDTTGLNTENQDTAYVLCFNIMWVGWS